ncbi:MAG: DUF5689 domain-containing protein [Maribacter sp.]
MILKVPYIKLITGFMAIILLCGCVKNRDFEMPTLECADDVEPNTSYSNVKSLYVDKTIQIQEDLILEGYVISSDKAGNFFSVVHFQDSPSNPSEGLQIEVDLRDSHLFFDVGQRILIKLKGLFLGKSKGVFKLGGVFSSFGNLSVGRLPNTAVFNHVLVSCDASETIVPFRTDIAGLTEDMVGTLIRIENIEVSEDDLGLSFALEREETERLLVDCADDQIILLNSGFSDFQEIMLPEKRGSITGLLTKENSTFQLVIRNLEDIQFDQERCEDLVDEFTSENIFFSELADPDNNSGARFVEIYNSGDEALSLKGWQVLRYTNASIEVSSSLSLSDYTIDAKTTLVISPNAQEFENVYGFAPDVASGTNSPSDSNGDDNLQLVDPFGTIIDVFGIIGEDGSGTNHEFEDGRAVRKIEVFKGNPNYLPTEWILYNDTVDNGTINSPQLAPSDFTPGER